MRSGGRRRFLTVAIAALTARSHYALGQQPAVTTIQYFYATLLRVMQAGSTSSFTQRYQMLAPAIERAFDMTTIARAAVGFGWSAFSPAGQSQVLASFQRYTIATWVSNFDSYSGQRLDVSPTPRSSGGAQVVHTQIVPRSGSPKTIDYVMRPANGAWRVVDVLLDGTISQVAVLRSDFGSLAAQGAPTLAQRLDRKTADLMGPV
jgi:phospholipid transport system substrate-binding protein